MTESPSSELCRVPLHTDLRPLSALLWRQRIAHRISEEGGEQVLRLVDATQRPAAETLLRELQSGELVVKLRPVPRPGGRGGFARALVAAPVTAAVIALGIVGFLVLYLPPLRPLVPLLSFEPFAIVNGGLVFQPQGGQLWRLVTPAFLHFGWLHITFNALWCWELGRRIEAELGSANLLGVFLVVAALANLAQFYTGGSTLFGGLSGVVYGWLAFAWVAGRVNPQWAALTPSPSIMVALLLWLVICLLGVLDAFGTAVANAAHVGGLIAGAALGGAFALLHRRTG